MDRDRILIVTQPDVTNTVGGAITVFVNFCNMLSKRGFDVYGVCYNKILGKPQNLDKDINFSNLYEEYKDLNFSDSINKKIEDIEPVLIIFFFHYLYIDAKLSDKYKDIPRILMFHSRPDFYFAIHPNAEKELEPIYINTTSQVLFDNYQSLLPKFIKENPVVTIPNGITLSNKQIDSSVEHKKIIYLSRIDCWKGLEFLIKSFNIIAKRYSEWSIDIYGQSQPPEYISELEEDIKKLHLEKQVCFKGITDNPIDIFKQYDFCVFPSYFEGFPMGLIEAQSVGLPCIGLKGCSGVNKLIIDGYNGFLSEDNPSDFATKIETLILDKNKRIEFSNNAILETKKYDIEIINDKWIETIEKILNKNIKSTITEVSSKDDYELFSINKIIEMGKTNKPIKNSFIENIFSIKNSTGKTHKIITILWIKFKIRRKSKNHA